MATGQSSQQHALCGLRAVQWTPALCQALSETAGALSCHLCTHTGFRAGLWDL